MLIVNFKTYKESTGLNALKLAKICEKISKKTNKQILIALQLVDIPLIKSKVKIPIIAQHVDAIEQGRNTGFVSL